MIVLNGTGAGTVSGVAMANEEVTIGTGNGTMRETVGGIEIVIGTGSETAGDTTRTTENGEDIVGERGTREIDTDRGDAIVTKTTEGKTKKAMGDGAGTSTLTTKTVGRRLGRTKSEADTVAERAKSFRCEA
mmetsp:Transcript_255/g.835  ORF Transcript_255/g.835 Transcript_255/m.835 type:complete len:132 (-) Transcript_255:27-422(-)